MVTAEEELWAAIDGYPRYVVSNLGQIRNVHKLGNMQLYKNIDGYLIAGLSNEYGRRKFLVHRLVLISFCGQNFEKPFVNHIDGDKTNNYLSNLEWVTPAENVQHASKMGLLTAGAVPKQPNY